MKQILKNIFGKKDRQQETLSQIETKNPKKTTSKKSAKELATERGEPYVNVISVELDPENIGSGAFELDWNDKFLANLVRAGYQKQANEPEHVIVDRWFQDVCRNVVLKLMNKNRPIPTYVEYQEKIWATDVPKLVDNPSR